MSDHRERACYEYGSLLHHEDDCPKPRTRTDVVDRAREWLCIAQGISGRKLVRDLLAEVEALRAERERLQRLADNRLGYLRQSDDEADNTIAALSDTLEAAEKNIATANETLRVTGAVAKSKIDSLRARVAKLEEALRPFAGQAIEHGAAEVPAVWIKQARAALEESDAE